MKTSIEIQMTIVSHVNHVHRVIIDLEVAIKRTIQYVQCVQRVNQEHTHPVVVQGHKIRFVCLGQYVKLGLNKHKHRLAPKTVFVKHVQRVHTKTKQVQQHVKHVQHVEIYMMKQCHVLQQPIESVDWFVTDTFTHQRPMYTIQPV